MKKGLDNAFSNWVHLVSSKDFENPTSNAIRFGMLNACRPFITDFQKEGTAGVEEWKLVRFLEADLNQLVLINAGDRREMSGDTLKPMDAAKRIEEGTIFVGIGVQQDADFIKTNVRALASDRSRIVVIGPESGPITVVDGVHRITAAFLHYFLRKEGKFTALEAYHGISRFPYAHRFG